MSLVNSVFIKLFRLTENLMIGYQIHSFCITRGSMFSNTTRF